MECNTSKQCFHPLGDCNSDGVNLSKYCICRGGYYALYSFGRNDCHYASDADAIVVQAVLILLQLAMIGLCIYKLQCLAEYVPSQLALPKLLCYIWLWFNTLMATVLLIGSSQTLSGSTLENTAWIFLILISPSVLGPMLYAAWFTTFAIQLVRQTPHIQRRIILGLFYSLCCGLALLISVFLLLTFVLSSSQSQWTHFSACLIVALVFLCMSVVLMGAPLSILYRFGAMPPYLVRKMFWTWILHFFLGMMTLVAMIDAILLAINALHNSPNVTLYTFNFYYLIIWMLTSGFTTMITINHRVETHDNEDEPSSHHPIHYHQLE